MSDASVLIAVEQWNPSGGGRERYAAEIAAALAARRWDVSIVCARRTSTCAGGTVPVATHSLNRLRSAVVAWRRGHPAQPVLSLLPLREATHVQFHSGVVRRAAAGERESFGRGPRRFFFNAANAANRRRRRQAREERDVCRSSMALMTFSNADAGALADCHFSTTARLTVSRPGIDLTRFRPSGTRRNEGPELRAMFVGHNFRLKGLRSALDLVRSRRQRMTLAVAGADWTPASLSQNAGVRFLGNLTQPELAATLAASDVLVHPAYYDPFPRAVIEAMACGAVPIVSRQCGAAEILRNGVDGFVVDSPAHLAAWHEALDLLQDPSRLEAMRRATIEAARRFTFTAHVDAVEHWLEQRPGDGA